MVSPSIMRKSTAASPSLSSGEDDPMLVEELQLGEDHLPYRKRTIGPHSGFAGGQFSRGFHQLHEQQAFLDERVLIQPHGQAWPVRLAPRVEKRRLIWKMRFVLLAVVALVVALAALAGKHFRKGNAKSQGFDHVQVGNLFQQQCSERPTATFTSRSSGGDLQAASERQCRDNGCHLGQQLTTCLPGTSLEHSRMLDGIVQDFSTLLDHMGRAGCLQVERCPSGRSCTAACPREQALNMNLQLEDPQDFGDAYELEEFRLLIQNKLLMLNNDLPCIESWDTLGSSKVSTCGDDYHDSRVPLKGFKEDLIFSMDYR